MLQKSPLQSCAVSHRSTIFFHFVYRYGFQTCLLWYIKILKCIAIVIVIFKHVLILLTDYFQCSFMGFQLDLSGFRCCVPLLLLARKPSKPFSYFSLDNNKFDLNTDMLKCLVCRVLTQHTLSTKPLSFIVNGTTIFSSELH